MRIGVDARPLATPHTGIGRYTAALLDEMVKMGHQWFLYSDRPLQVEMPRTPRLWLRCADRAGRTPASLFWSQWQFSRWATQDVIDLFWSPRHHLPLFLKKPVARIVTIHDMVWCRMPETMLLANRLVESALMGPSIRRADRVICVSRFTASEVSRYYPSALGKCEVIHAAVQEDIVPGEMPVGVPEDFLLFVGTLEPRKNVPRLLLAYWRLREDPAVPPLVIVGGAGWGKEDIRGQVEKLGLQDRVLLCGNVTDAELQALYASARCLLMPSLYEGFGLPILEAMQHGVPVIASSTGALPEVAGSACIMVDPYSEEEIAAAVRRLVHEGGLHQSLSARGVERARKFSWQRAAHETLQVFDEALSQHQPRAFRHRVLDENLG